MTEIKFQYSQAYADDKFEYRVVDVAGKLPRTEGNFMTEDEWKAIGMQMSKGWVHCSWGIYRNQLIFKRPIGTNPDTGIVEPARRDAALETFKQLWK